MSFKGRIDPPVDELPKGCTDSCIYTFAVVWVTIIFLLIYGTSGCVRMLK